MNDAVEVKLKRFVAIPRDAMDLLERRYVNADEATEAAKDAVATDGMTVYVLEMKAVVTRADRPVTVRKL